MATVKRTSAATPVPSEALTRLDVDLLAVGGPFDPRHGLTLTGAALSEWTAERAAWIAAVLAGEEV